MELWIRSQDNEVLIKANELEIEENMIIGFINNIADFRYLGTYATKERALEVLDEIEKRITLINTISLANDRDSLLACQKALGEEEIQGLSYPYQMPEN